MARVRVLRIPEELDQSIEGAAGECGSSYEGFMIFSALFYLELVREGQIVAHTQEKHQQFIRLVASGRSLRSIEGVVGISHGTAVAWKRKYDGRICEMSKDDMDQILEAWAEVKNQRIAKLADQIRRVEEELLERDLSKISSGTLMRLDLAYRQELRQEVEPVVSVLSDPSTDNYLAILKQCAVIED